MIFSHSVAFAFILTFATITESLYALNVLSYRTRLPKQHALQVPESARHNNQKVFTKFALTSGMLGSLHENRGILQRDCTNVVARRSHQRNESGSNAAPPGFLRTKFPSIPWHRLPDWLTYCRCAAIPLLMGLFYLPNQNIATCSIFIAASATDYLDGYLARRWDISSDFGAFLDPVADKLLVSTVLILLSGRDGALVATPACVILAREIAVSALREWMAGQGLRQLVQVGYQGKVKTAATMTSLAMMLILPIASAGIYVQLRCFSLFLLYLSAVITVTSGWSYFRAAFN